MKLIAFLIANITICMAWDIMSAYNCNNPTNVKFVTHDKCKKETHQESNRLFTLIQTDSISNISAVQCKVEETSITRYCGAYSHQKTVGEDIYNMPRLISPEECHRLVKERTVMIGDKTHALEINKINYVKGFTHGGVSYSTTNVYCVGDVLTLDNGMAVSNMMKEEHMKIEIQEIKLINNDGNVIYPLHQTKIGLEEEGYGYVETSTIIWTSRRPRCQKNIISTIKMTTTDGEIFYNHPNMIQIKVKEQFYDSECGAKMLATDLPGIFLSDQVTKKSKMKRMHTQSIHLDSHYTTQLHFIAAEVQRELRKKYSFTNSPACTRIMNAKTTTEIGGGRFVRSLGDASVLFECPLTSVSPANITDACYKQLPVLDENRRKWYLDSTTRILLEHGAKTHCSSANVPIYRNLEGELISFLPKRTSIKTENLDITESETVKYNDETGLYPEQVVSEWLKLAYMQDFQEISYTALHTDLCNKNYCENGVAPSDDVSNALAEYYNKINKIPVPGNLFGIDFVSLGGNCSIVVCCAMAIYIVNYSVNLIIRFIMLKDDSSTTKTNFFRACCLNLYLIAKIRPNNENESRDE